MRWLCGSRVTLAPRSPAGPNWDEAVDVGTHATNGQLRIRTLGADVPAGLPVLTAAGPGWYRVRVCAAGRDLHLDGTSLEQPHERYLIQVWPGEPRHAAAAGAI